MALFKKYEPSLLSFLGFIIAISYIPGWIGASISTNWFSLFIFISLLICFYEIPITIIHKFGMLIFSYCCLTLLWTYNFNYGFFAFLQLSILAIVFCLGSALDDVKPIFKGLALGIGLSGIITIVQYFFGFDLIFTANKGAGLFVNKDIACEASVVVLITLITFKLWWYIPTTLPAIILIHSRAAILALVGSFCFWLWIKSKTAVLFLIIFLGFIFYLNVHGFDSSTVQRIQLWTDTINGFKLFGNGIGSYELMYPAYAVNVDTVFERPKYAHNELLQWIFEFGIGTILLIPLIWYLSINNRIEKIIIYAIGIISCFSFPLHVPLIAFIGFLVAGHITRLDDPNGYFRFSWRSILFKRIEAKQS